MTATPSPSPQPADGERGHLLRLVDSLSDTYRPAGITIWLNSRNRILGASPSELMEQGRWDELHAEAERLAGGPREQEISRYVATLVTCPRCLEGGNQ